VTNAKGQVTTISTTTNASGVATASYTVNNKTGGKGTYTIQVTATKSGYTTWSGAKTFSVN
jgi:hypothetical protein